MDGYGWFGFDRVCTLCTPKMAHVLATRMDLGGVLAQLLEPPEAAVAAA